MTKYPKPSLRKLERRAAILVGCLVLGYFLGYLVIGHWVFPAWVFPAPWVFSSFPSRLPLRSTVWIPRMTYEYEAPDNALSTAVERVSRKGAGPPCV